MSKKFEQLLEYVVNDEMDKANALFHDIVVAKSREIYENLITDELDEEMIGGSPTSDLIGEIEEEEDAYSLGEEDDMGDEESDVVDGGDDEESDLGEPLDMDSEDDGMDMDSEEGSGDPELDQLEDDMAKAQDMLASIQQAFDKISAKDAGEEHSDELAADDESMDDEMDENAIFEYKEHAPKPKTSEEPNTNTTSPLAKNAKSPTGVGKPIAVKDGSQGNHGVKAPGKLTSYDTKGSGTKMTKVQDMKKV